MKKIAIILMSLVFGLSTFAQEDMLGELMEQEKKQDGEIKTIFGSIETNGGYGGFGLRLGQINEVNSIWNGGQGGWIINHNIAIGGAGYGFTTSSFDVGIVGDKYMFSGGFGGLLIEPILFPKFPVHLAFPTIIGAGGITYSEDYGNFNHDNFNTDYQSKAFFVAAPAVELELNMLKFMRLAVGAYYKYTTDADLSLDDGTVVTKPGVLREGLTYGFTIKFGKF